MSRIRLSLILTGRKGFRFSVVCGVEPIVYRVASMVMISAFRFVIFSLLNLHMTE